MRRKLFRSGYRAYIAAQHSRTRKDPKSGDSFLITSKIGVSLLPQGLDPTFNVFTSLNAEPRQPNVVYHFSYFYFGAFRSESFFTWNGGCREFHVLLKRSIPLRRNGVIDL